MLALTTFTVALWIPTIVTVGLIVSAVFPRARHLWRRRASRRAGVASVPRPNGMSPLKIVVLPPQANPGAPAPLPPRNVLKGVDGRDYVYVRSDGSARELKESELAYLGTDFEAADGGRPYIKPSYDYLTPDGSIRGFLHRSQLPEGVAVDPPDDAPEPPSAAWVAFEAAVRRAKSDLRRRGRRRW